MAEAIVSPGVQGGFQYGRHKRHMNRGTIVRRQRTKQTPSDGGTVWAYEGNRIIDFLFPTAGFADMNSCWASVELTIDEGTTTGISLSNAGASSLIDRVELMTTGGSNIFTIQDYPTITGNFLMRGYTYDYLEGHGNTFGYGSPAQRQADAGGSARIRLAFDWSAFPLFNGDLHPPLFAQGLMIRVHLRQDNSALVSATGTDATYSIRAARLSADIMYMNKDMTDLVAGVLEGGGAIRAVCDGFEVLRKSLGTDAANFNLDIPKYVSDLFSMNIAFVRSDKINVMTEDQFDGNYFPNLNQAQITVGPDVFPNQQMDLTQNGLEGLQTLRQIMEALQAPISAVRDENKAYTNFNGGSGRQFVLGMPMFKDKNASIGGGYRTDNPNEPIVLQLNNSANLANVTTAYVIAHYRGLLVWRAGSLQWIISGMQDELRRDNETPE